MKKHIALFLTLLAVGVGACQGTGTPEPATQAPATATTAPTTAPQKPTELPPSEVATTAPAPAPSQAPSIEPTAPPTPTTTPLPQPATAIRLSPIVSGLARPTYLTHAFDGRLFVTEQAGRIWIIEDGQLLSEPFLDIRDRVGSAANEQGLLSIAFHPDYTENGRFFVDYTDQAGHTVVARFQVAAGEPNRADRDSEFVLLKVDQPYANHNGGQLQFGPDGMLYVGLGDGGSAGDPQGNGQNPATLLGSLLRLDVDGQEPYQVPADNPFAGLADKAGEIWAFGLRNPWRFSFDRLTEDLIIADVGQGTWEEVDFQPASSAGGEDYGWNIMEGNHCYATSNCDTSGLVLPVAEYSHAEGGCSVTGGYVYRGSAFPELAGNYFFGDYCSGFIWSLVPQPDGTWLKTQVLDSQYNVASFGEDAEGELYVLDHSSGAVLQLQGP